MTMRKTLTPGCFREKRQSRVPGRGKRIAVRGLRAALFQARRELGSEAVSAKGWHFPAEILAFRESTQHIVATEPDEDLLRFTNS